MARVWLAGTALLVICGCGLIPVATSTGEGSIRGRVVDSTGQPLAEVTVQICGIETLKNGNWTREFYLGMLPKFQTDSAGRFLIPVKKQNLRYDLWFDRNGKAPSFLSSITPETGEIQVTLDEGTILSGRVMRQLPNNTPAARPGPKTPVAQTVVYLRLPAEDLWYQQRSFTDTDGVYRFHVSTPPPGSHWQVDFLGQIVVVEIGEAKEIVGPDFLVDVRSIDQ